MPTEDEGTIIPIERSISELLALDTYQGMTDSEIERIIAYKAALLADSNETVARVNMDIDTVNSILDEQTALCNVATNVLQYLLGNPPTMQLIEE